MLENSYKIGKEQDSYENIDITAIPINAKNGIKTHVTISDKDNIKIMDEDGHSLVGNFISLLYFLFGGGKDTSFPLPFFQLSDNESTIYKGVVKEDGTTGKIAVDLEVNFKFDLNSVFNNGTDCAVIIYRENYTRTGDIASITSGSFVTIATDISLAAPVVSGDTVNILIINSSNVEKFFTPYNSADPSKNDGRISKMKSFIGLGELDETLTAERAVKIADKHPYPSNFFKVLPSVIVDSDKVILNFSIKYKNSTLGAIKVDEISLFISTDNTDIHYNIDSPTFVLLARDTLSTALSIPSDTEIAISYRVEFPLEAVTTSGFCKNFVSALQAIFTTSTVELIDDSNDIVMIEQKIDDPKFSRFMQLLSPIDNNRVRMLSGPFENNYPDWNIGIVLLKELDTFTTETFTFIDPLMHSSTDGILYVSPTRVEGINFNLAGNGSAEFTISREVENLSGGTVSFKGIGILMNSTIESTVYKDDTLHPVVINYKKLDNEVDLADNTRYCIRYKIGLIL